MCPVEEKLQLNHHDVNMPVVFLLYVGIKVWNFHLIDAIMGHVLVL